MTVKTRMSIFHSEIQQTIRTKNKSLYISQIIRTSHMNEEEKQKITKLRKKYSNII